MDNETGTVNWTCSAAEAGMMRENESSKERQAKRRTVIVTSLGIGIFVLSICAALLMRYPEKRRQRRAIEIVKAYRLAPNERSMEQHFRSAAIEAGGKSVRWKARRVPGAPDEYEVKSMCLNESNQWGSWTFECRLDSGYVKPLGFTRLAEPKTNANGNGASDRTNAAAPHTGQVTAIAYSKDNPSAVMGSRIVHEGDTIDRVKVIKIERGKVHFEKNGRKWAQGVGVAPPSHWK